MMSEVQASAPGRVNLIGEHTDYNGGYVLPMVIPQRTTVTLRRRVDRNVVVHSREIGTWEAYALGAEARIGSWLDYVQGCTAMLREAGHPLAGIDLAISSDVPLGSGLSSSAALEVAVLRALRDAFELAIDDTALALLGQRAENVVVGAPVGAMDQLAVSLGTAGAALFIDLRTLATRAVALPDTVDLIVIGSGIAHDHATGDYRIRRAECDEAARLLGVAQLRDLGEAELADLPALPEPLAARVRHVVSENARVLATVEALERGDLAAVGALFAASHVSMRDDFAVSLPAIDALVGCADADADVIGARLTGGGFGGSIVALATRGAGGAAAERIAARYLARTHLTARVLIAGAPCARS
jgi:galactokinase